MSNARSAFTEAIEDHLALKKQNTTLEAAMPLARYDVGDPLDRYPGGPNRAADGTVVIADDVAADAFEAFDAAPATAASPAETTGSFASFGPSPEQAMEAATALEHAFGDRPFAPLNGLAPMLSLVEDIDEDDAGETTGSFDAVSADAAPAAAPTQGDLVRFPGGVGPREEDPAQQSLIADAPDALETHSFGATMQQPAVDAADMDAATGEQPVLVIDTDEPAGGMDWSNEPAAPVRSRKKPRFFGIGRKKAEKDAADGWFTDGPRDFNWD